MDGTADFPKLQPQTFRQRVWSSLLGLFGWMVCGELSTASKYVMIVAPHTSTWDFPILFAGSRAINLPFPNWIAKHSIFVGPVGWLLRKVGGIPLDRKASVNFVQQMSAYVDGVDRAIIALAPEGTRRKTDHWKSGFYHMAYGVGMPISMVAIDYSRRRMTVAPGFMPTGDADADMEIVRAFYAGVQGRHPELQSDMRLRTRLSNGVVGDQPAQSVPGVD